MEDEEESKIHSKVQHSQLSALETFTTPDCGHARANKQFMNRKTVPPVLAVGGAQWYAFIILIVNPKEADRSGNVQMFA